MPSAEAPPPSVSVTVKPICEPAVTLSASACLSIESAGFLPHEGNEKLPIRVRQS